MSKGNQARQDVESDEDSSDVPVDDHSTMLELLQKLKKVDPDSLILNFAACDNEELESELEESDLYKTNVDVLSHSSDSMKEFGMKRHDLFAFAAYIPPGKHLLLCRDVGTSKYKKHENYPERSSSRQ